MSYAELVKRKGELVADDLVLALRDGRAAVRANAALGLAAVGYTGRDLLPFLRDSEPIVAQAAAEAMVHLLRAQREHLVAIAAALDGARPVVVDAIARMFAELVGQADVELVGVLDTADRGAANAVIEGCARVGASGLHLLQAATRDARALVRLNAVHGVGRLAYLEPVSSLEVMHRLALEDGVSDVRAVAGAALAAYIARSRTEAAAKAGEHTPSKVPALTARALTPDELRAAAADARLDELVTALDDERVEIRLNAVRVLALQGAAAGGAAPALAVATRDIDRTVRLESVGALAALAKGGVVAAPALARALGDPDPAVVAVAEAALAEQGAAVASTLVDGLDVASEAHGARIAALIARLPDGPSRLRAALASTSVDVRVNAALGLGALGTARAGDVLGALGAATSGGNARVRAAVAQAIAALALRPERPLPPLAIDGFERRVLAEADLARHKDALTGAGVAGLVPRLADARAIVRANAATAVGTLGPAAAGQAITVAALLRDDDDRVRIAAAHALDQLGDDAVVAAAPALVGALRGDAGLAEVCRGVLAARKGRVEAALVAGLETPDQTHGMRIADLIVALPNARDLLFAAFDGEAQNVQINAAFGVAKLGAKRAGPEGRQRLLNGLPGPPTRRRDAMLKALAMLGESPAS